MEIKAKYIAAIVIAFIILELSLIFMLDTGSETKVIAKVADSGTINISINPPTAAISTDQGTYQQYSVVLINGSGYSVNASARLNISNSTGHTVAGFPADAVTNASGAFNRTWNISSNNTGTYTIRATDLITSDSASKTITVVSGVVCNDGICSGSESCITCPSDCGACAEAVPAPPTEAAPRTVTTCPSQDRIISLDLDIASNYVETLSSCDKAFVIFKRKAYEFHIRRYMSSINSLELEIGKNRFVLPAGNVKELDLDGDGKLDMAISFMEVRFDVVFQLSSIPPVVLKKISPIEFAPVVRETLPPQERLETMQQVAAMLLLLLIIVTIGMLTSYWRKILRERK